ncbi:hypothetical protein ABPG72_013669 [Tetrahymena utriculariae]
MDQLKKRICDKHNLSITFIYADSNSQEVLKCLYCLQQNLDLQKIIPIESFNNNDDELLQHWTLSKEKDLTDYYIQVQEEIKQLNYEEKIKNTQTYFKQLLTQLQKKIENEMELQIKLIQNQQELKQKYLLQYQNLTLWDQLKNIMINQHQYKTQDLNQLLKQIIQKSINNSNNTKQILSKLIGDIKNKKDSQVSNSFFQEIYKFIEETMLKFQDKKTKPVFNFQQQNNQFQEEKYQQNQNPNKEDFKTFNFQKNSFFKDNQNNQYQDNNKQKQNFYNMNQDQNNWQQQYFNENRNNNNQNQQFRQSHFDNNQNLENVKQIMKLISNKTNGCQQQFLQEIESMLSNTKEIFLNLNFTNAYTNNSYPLQFDQLDEIQFSNLIEYSKFPYNFQFTKIDEEKNNLQKDENLNQETDLINFDITNFQNSKQFKIKLENNSIFIDNTNKCYQGQVVTSTPLSLQKIYSFTISLNKPFVNNLLYFGLISTQDKDTKALKDVQEGFSFSNLSAQRPNLIFGSSFEDDNIQLEVRINLKNGTMHIFQYPEFSTIYVQNLKDKQNTHFGIQYQTEQQIKIKIQNLLVIDI